MITQEACGCEPKDLNTVSIPIWRAFLGLFGPFWLCEERSRVLGHRQDQSVGVCGGAIRQMVGLTQMAPRHLHVRHHTTR